MENKKWVPTKEENLGIITSVYEFIKEELSELQKLSEPIDCLKIIGFPFSKSMVHRKSIVLICRTNRLPKDHRISFFKSMVHRKSMVFLFKTNGFPIHYSSI